MDENVQSCLNDAKANMDKAIQHLESELQKIRAGKANPAMLDGLQVDYYGNSTPLNQVANVNTTDAHTLVIQPWEKQMIEEIEKAIQNSNLGLNPQNDGTLIRINVPPLTEERRTELVKKVKAEIENCKVSLRNVRKDANDTIKQLQKDGLAEDMAKDGEAKVQELTDDYSKKSDALLAVKEKEIMTV